jgi:hypothetical protein
VAKAVLGQQRNQGKQQEKLPKSVEKLEEIAKLLDKLDVDTDLTVEDAKRGLDALSRCSDRCRALVGQLKRPAMAHKAESGNIQSALKNLNAL